MVTDSDEDVIIAQVQARPLNDAENPTTWQLGTTRATLAKAETILPAPESSHAIRVAIDEALKCKETGEEKTIMFNLSGHGHFDMASYDKYFSGELTNE